MLRRAGRALFVARNRALLAQASTRAVGKGATNPTLTSQTAAKNDPDGTGSLQFGKNKEESAMYQQVGGAWEAMRKVGQASPIEQSIERWEDRYQTEGTGQEPRQASGQPSLWERAKDAVSAVKDSISSNAEKIKLQAAEKKEELSAQASQSQDKMNTRMSETKDSLGDKLSETKDSLGDKFQQAKESISDKFANAKEAVGQRLDNIKESVQSHTPSAGRTRSRDATSSYTKIDASRSAMSEEIPLSQLHGNLSPEDEVLAAASARSHKTSAFHGIDNVAEARSTEDWTIKSRGPESYEVKRPELRFTPEPPTAEERDEEGLDVAGTTAPAPTPKNLQNNKQQKKQDSTMADDMLSAASLSGEQSLAGTQQKQKKEREVSADIESQPEWIRGLPTGEEPSLTMPLKQKQQKNENRGQWPEAKEEISAKKDTQEKKQQKQQTTNLSRQQESSEGFNMANDMMQAASLAGDQPLSASSKQQDQQKDKQEKKQQKNLSSQQQRSQTQESSQEFNMADDMMQAASLSGDQARATKEDRQKEYESDKTRCGNDGFGNIQNTSAVRDQHKGEHDDIFAVDDGDQNTSASSNQGFDHQRGIKENVKDEGPAKEALRKTGEQLKAGWQDLKDTAKNAKKNIKQSSNETGERDEAIDRHIDEKSQSAEHSERNARVPKKEPTRYGDWEHTGRTTDF